MSEETVIRQCAPTLAGIKTGSLFSCPCQDKKEMQREIASFNRQFSSKGLCLLPLKYEESKGRVLLYMYRPNGLKEDLQNELAREVLEQEGYPWADAGRCVVRLIRKLSEDEEFPHEIGLFLSYPPEDVKGFMDNHADNFKYSGIWKVYGDVDHAKNLFARFKKCTETYCRLWQQGQALSQLAVAR